jgi:hypothetical protein
MNSEFESKKENKELVLKLQFDKNKDEIYRVYELSDNRMAIELEKSIKIYSLKNFKLITEINDDNNIGTSIELKNKDIALTRYCSVNFYKLSGSNYIFSQEISEEGELFEIYELKNENLITCSRRQISIYSKDKGDYKILSKIELEESVGGLFEIKNNILSLFLLSRCDSYCTADYSPYFLQIIDFENKKICELNQGYFSYYDNDEIYCDCNFIKKENKYLFARYAGYFDIYNIENIDKIILIFRLDAKENKIDDYKCLVIGKIFDYDDDNLIELSCNNIYKYDEKLKKINLVKKINFEFGIEEIINIKKIRNNKYYVAYNKNEIVIIKSL